MFIIADDLTGANDTAIQFVKHGFSALVITNAQFPDSALDSAYDIFSFNTDSRGMNGTAAFKTVRNLVRRLKTLKLEGACYKKIDSVLRGNPGPELAAVMDELEIPLAIVAPSFPANRSTVENGMLKSGAAGSQTEFDAVKIFTDTMDKKVESIPLEKIRQGEPGAAEYLRTRQACGAQVFVADALADDDLAIIYRLSAALSQPHILAGSAGLGNQIAGNLKKDKKEREPPFSPHSSAEQRFLPALVIAGTRQGETAAQVSALSENLAVPVVRFKTDLAMNGKSGEAVKLAYGEAAEQMKNKPEFCIVAVESLFNAKFHEGDFDRGMTGSDAIVLAMGSLARTLMDSFRFPVIITTGGDTSLEICKSLGVAGIKPLAEICPGIPIGKIAGGAFENHHIVTKSGRFGAKNALIDIINYLAAK